jgi:hypothetical protein
MIYFIYIILSDNSCGTERFAPCEGIYQICPHAATRHTNIYIIMLDKPLSDYPWFPDVCLIQVRLHSRDGFCHTNVTLACVR